MGNWQDISTAPKDGSYVLLFGTVSEAHCVTFSGPVALSGYFDDMDDSWCSTTSSWMGPFIDATHWMPLPDAPPHQIEVQTNERYDHSRNV